MFKISILLTFVSVSLMASDPYPKNDAIDVTHYVFQLEVNDSTDIINGRAFVTILFKKPIREFELDLKNKDVSGKGMEVQVVLHNSKLAYTHRNNRLKIALPFPPNIGDQLTFQINYKGIPQDGFIIGNNKFGDRGFFGDNWPDRGHHWLPVVDHPSDKASVDFIVIAPSHYSVIANGIKLEESLIDKKRKLTHWHEEVPIPVKVMVAGIARFAVQYVGKIDGISVETWVFPQNRLEGFHDFSVATKVLEYFNRSIGPYPYKKLANVQSKTRWGGLENANTIFYFENAVTGKGEREELIAHEEAHQWFGNSATENDWHHVWLSEGFATYFANLYLENAYGRPRLVEEQEEDRKQVIEFYYKNQSPIVDTTLTDINKVLSTNTYQKAGWVLHMLRHEVGDEPFWAGIRKYYHTYKNSNALTSDFQKIMEEVSAKDLSFFSNNGCIIPVILILPESGISIKKPNRL
jgi:aminopeptidase N